MTRDEGLRTRLRVLSRAFRRVELPHIRQRLAEEIAELGTPEAYGFLIKQAGEDHPRADYAIDGLVSVGDDAVAHLIRAILERPDAQGLALALPPELPDDAATELLGVLPAVTDPAALRWLTQKIAEGHPKRMDSLVAVAADKDDHQKISMVVGMADAGHQGCAESVRRLVATTDPFVLRLVLSCRATWDVPEANERVAELLISGHAADRKFALTIINEAGWTAFAPEALRLAVHDADPIVHLAALKTGWLYAEADASACMAVVEEVAAEFVDAAREARIHSSKRMSTDAWDAIAEACAEARDHARRVLAALTPDAELGRAAAMRLLRAIERASADIAWVLQDQAPPEPLFAVYEHVLALQLDLSTSLWRAGGVHSFALLQKLMGTITVDHADAIEPMAGNRDSQWLLQRLRELARESAHIVVAQMAAEDAHRGDLLRQLSIARYRRLSVLAQLPLAHRRVRRVTEALRESRDREAVAIGAAVDAYGKQGVHELQTESNERALVAGTFAEARVRRFMVRAGDVAIGREGWRELGFMAPVIAEQILQADLLASLAIGEATPPANVLIDGLVSRSADVHAAAEQMLWRHGRRLSRELVKALDESDDAVGTASILEVLRCADHPQLDHAREAATAEHELLRAVGVKCLGAWGEKRDAERALLALDDSSELVQTSAVEALGNLDPAAHIEALYKALGSPRFPVRDRAVQALAKLDVERLARLTRRAQDDGNHWQRVGMSGMLESLTSGGDPAVRRWRGVPFLPGGDSVLGPRMAFAGQGPWQWGLTGLCQGPSRDFGVYASLVEDDEELCEAWDQWMIIGYFPFEALPRLQTQAARGRPEGIAAAAFAVAGLHSQMWNHVLLPAVDYYGLELDADMAFRFSSLVVEAFCRCTPDVVSELAMPNPSAASVWPKAMADDDAESDGLRLVLTITEVLKELLARDFGRVLELPHDDVGAFRAAVERAWDRLQPYQDWFYGFWVTPDVALDDLGRYCAERGCKREYRRMICSYLAYLATTAPCLASKRREARRAVATAYRSRLDAAVTTATKDQAIDRDAAMDNLLATLESALDEFDIYWASPQPMMPLGTLDMAWSPQRDVEDEFWTVLPERHLPFARMVEQLVRSVIRDFRESPGRDAESPEDEDDARSLEELAWSGQLSATGRRDGFEDEVLEAIVSGEPVEAVVDSQLRAGEPVMVSPRQYDISVNGRAMRCVDIRGASMILDRDVDTLRRRHERGDLPFVWHQGRRCLSVDDLPAARVVLRDGKEWAALLGVSRATFYRWKADLPDDLDPLEMEGRLLKRASKHS